MPGRTDEGFPMEDSETSSTTLANLAVYEPGSVTLRILSETETRAASLARTTTTTTNNDEHEVSEGPFGPPPPVPWTTSLADLCLPGSLYLPGSVPPGPPTPPRTNETIRRDGDLYEVAGRVNGHAIEEMDENDGSDNDRVNGGGNAGDHRGGDGQTNGLANGLIHGDINGEVDRVNGVNGVNDH